MIKMTSEDDYAAVMKARDDFWMTVMKHAHPCYALSYGKKTIKFIDRIIITSMYHRISAHRHIEITEAEHLQFADVMMAQWQETVKKSYDDQRERESQTKDLMNVIRRNVELNAIDNDDDDDKSSIN